MSRIRLGVAYLFRRAGAAELTEDAFLNQVSHDLHWFSPKQSRRFLEAARALGYVVDSGGSRSVGPSFPVDEVELPLDFQMGPEDLEDIPEGPAGAGVVEELVAAVAHARGTDSERVWAQVRRKEAELFETPVAALLVAGEAGIDVREYARRVREELRHAPPARATSSASGSGRRS